MFATENDLLKQNHVNHVISAREQHRIEVGQQARVVFVVVKRDLISDANRKKGFGKTTAFHCKSHLTQFGLSEDSLYFIIAFTLLNICTVEYKCL